MEEAKRMAIEIEMAEEAEKSTVPPSVGMRRRRNDAARELLLSTLEILLEKMNSLMLPGSSVATWGLRTEFEKIVSTFSVIKDVLQDAEERQLTSEAGKRWLTMVKDVVYDAEDELDEIELKAMQEKLSEVIPFLFPYGFAIRLKKIIERLDDIVPKKDHFDLREQVGDREEGSSDWTQTSSPVEKPQIHGKDNQKKEETTEWTLLMTNLLLEAMSAISDQLCYALLGMVVAFVALVLSTIDLFRMSRMGKNTWDGRSLLPCFRCHSTGDLSTRKPFGTIVEYFGFIGAVWQCFYSTMEYAYTRRNKDNPVKMCLLPFIFLVCVIVSKNVKQAHKPA